MTGEVGSPAALLDLLNAVPGWALGLGCGLILAGLLWAALWAWGWL